jgi:hypothetical protein
LPCSEREVSVPQELSGRLDRGAPGVHRRGAKRVVRLGRGKMTLDVKGVLDRGVRGEKFLRRTQALEPLHLALLPSRRLMRILRSIVPRALARRIVLPGGQWTRLYPDDEPEALYRLFQALPFRSHRPAGIREVFDRPGSTGLPHIRRSRRTFSAQWLHLAKVTTKQLPSPMTSDLTRASSMSAVAAANSCHSSWSDTKTLPVRRPRTDRFDLLTAPHPHPEVYEACLRSHERPAEVACRTLRNNGSAAAPTSTADGEQEADTLIRAPNLVRTRR